MSEYALVQKNKTNGQKFVNIRKSSYLQDGDWVEIKKAKEVDENGGKIN